MRTIAVITTGRADYGIYLPIIKKIAADSGMKLCLVAGGAHLSAEYGLTVKMFKADGFRIAARVECVPLSDAPVSVSGAMGRAFAGFAEAYDRLRPDIVLVVGDRFEMFAAAAAAVPLLLPIAHIHGGEITEGAMDESFRHAITKMSHLHFVATAESRRRVLQMGEEAWRVTLSGAPSLDNLRALKLSGVAELERTLGVRLEKKFILATYHPVTLEYGDTKRQITEILEALEDVRLPAVFTAPNADTERSVVQTAVERFVKQHPDSCFVKNLGTQMYFSLMKRAVTMVGNSSSGILEAASFGLPVVNIGNRQRGRLHGDNVVDVPCERAAISRAIRRVALTGFREGLRGLKNPYGGGQASARIVEVLRSVPLGRKLIVKRFVDTYEN